MRYALIAALITLPSVASAGSCWETETYGLEGDDGIMISEAGITLPEGGSCDLQTSFSEDGRPMAVACWQEGDSFVATVTLTPLGNYAHYSMEYLDGPAAGSTEELTLQVCDKRA